MALSEKSLETPELEHGSVVLLTINACSTKRLLSLAFTRDVLYIEPFLDCFSKLSPSVRNFFYRKK